MHFENQGGKTIRKTMRITCEDQSMETVEGRIALRMKWGRVVAAEVVEGIDESGVVHNCRAVIV